jgi:hypothetical protein
MANVSVTLCNAVNRRSTLGGSKLSKKSLFTTVSTRFELHRETFSRIRVEIGSTYVRTHMYIHRCQITARGQQCRGTLIELEITDPRQVKQASGSLRTCLFVFHENRSYERSFHSVLYRSTVVPLQSQTHLGMVKKERRRERE